MINTTATIHIMPNTWLLVADMDERDGEKDALYTALQTTCSSVLEEVAPRSVLGRVFSPGEETETAVEEAVATVQAMVAKFNQDNQRKVKLRALYVKISVPNTVPPAPSVTLPA